MNFLVLPKGFSIGPFHLTFYAIFIVMGAIVAYVLARYTTRKEGEDDKVLENTFYLAFPAGIVGARIWYVIAEWSKEFAGQPLWKIFAIWEGGLAIQGGVILGVIVGVGYVYSRNHKYPILKVADYAVPGILVAQAIGRWGNFFNQEVYGRFVERSDWSFLPSFILDQMQVKGCSATQIAVPLFLIESVLNLIGFLVIYFGIRVGLRKWRAPGDCVGAYFIWYGIVRAVLEPLRNPIFQMGTDIMASKMMAYVFIGAGILMIIASHVYANYRKKFVNEDAETEADIEE